MKSNYSPSVNIIRDTDVQMNYIVTQNAEKTALKIFNDFQKGFHAFSIIGSYGTGKSSFLWALEQTLKGNQLFDVSVGSDYDNIEIIKLVGSYHSILEQFNDVFSIESDYASSQKLFNAIYQRYDNLGENSLMVIAIDEFGKALEYAANNEPEKEMYFIQQLAEFVNAPDRNILLITTLHQGLDAYAHKLTDAQKNEWRKVKGRLQEITFNEPVEQLLALAASHFEAQLGVTKETTYSKALIKLQREKRIFSMDDSHLNGLKNSLYPLDIFSAYTLTLSLQRYGQNERSLFSFLVSSDELGLFEEKKSFSIASVYDFLINNYYQTLSSSATLDASSWRAIRDAIQRTETLDYENKELAEKLVKTVGLLQLLASKGGKVDDDFIITYFSDNYTKKEVTDAVRILKKAQIIRYFQFDFSYKLYQGSDLDIEGELLKAENQVPKVIDLVPKLEAHFDFPILSAKSISYEKGTPRLFEYQLSEHPISIKPEGDIDGFINLIFNPKLSLDKIKESSHEEPILYAYFKQSEKIVSTLYDIEKTKQVLKNIKADDDKVARKALYDIINGNATLLNHYVLNSLFDQDSVSWVYNGEVVSIDSQKELNKQLSIICRDVYHATPTIKNELFNKHTVSAAITSARKSYFQALVENHSLKDLGFSEDKFPPEKTIYYTLLKESGIHSKSKSEYSLTVPNENSPIRVLWDVCSEFLSSAKEERKKLTELYDILSSAPYKLKQGVIDFWVPTFLFVRKGDFALYSEGNFKPYINQQELYLITRNPQDYEVKSFELNELRVSFFNKYRELLTQDQETELSLSSFIESIRPILLTYKNLEPYAQKTKRISKEAIQLREAIRNTKDPEKVFFTEFPKALSFDVNDLHGSDEHFDDYIYKFQSTLEEMQNAYSELLNRIEKFITSEIVGRKCEFEAYKKALIKRFSTIKEHQLLPKQRTFIQRINSPLNDRDSWLASIGQVLTGKPLSSIDDKDELILKENLLHFTKELDNLSDLAKMKYDAQKEDVFKLDLTTQEDGLKTNLVRVPKEKLDAIKDKIQDIDEALGKDKKMRIAILAKLLKNELNNGKS